MRLTALLLITLTAFAQNMPEVRGTVVEYGTNPPISAAEVVLYEFVTIDGLLTRQLKTTIVTDARGGFTLKPEHPGSYFVEAKKATYLTGEEMEALGPIPGPHLAETPLTVTREGARDIRFILIRPGGLTGRVVDEDDKPVPNFTLTSPLPGIPQSLSARAITDRDGVFTFPSLVPAPRAIRAGPEDQRPLSLIQDFKKEDLALIEHEVQTSYWPGGVTDPALALPVNVIPGANANVGTIRLRKSPYYRAHIRYAGDCGDGEGWAMTLLEISRSMAVNCSKELLIGKLTAGPHMLAVWKRSTPPAPAQVLSWALLPFSIDRENVELEFNLTPSMTVTGRIVSASGNKLPDLSKTLLLLRPVGLGFSTPGDTAKIDVQGNFTMSSVAWPRHQVWFALVNQGLAVKEIRYNSQPVTDGIIAVAPGAQLEIVLDDQPASLSGVAGPGADVYLARWPLATELLIPVNVPPYTHLTRADASGKFRLGSLAAGDYRLIVVSNAESISLADPQVLGRLLEAGQRVTIERGVQQTIEVKR